MGVGGVLPWCSHVNRFPISRISHKPNLFAFTVSFESSGQEMHRCGCGTVLIPLFKFVVIKSVPVLHITRSTAALLLFLCHAVIELK